MVNSKDKSSVTSEMKLPRPIKRSAKGLDTRKRTLMRAAELFAERGYAAVGLQEIADASGLSKGALFSHFDSKRQIYTECAVMIFEETLGSYIPSKSAKTAKEHLHHYLEWILPAMTKNPLLSRLTLHMVVDRDMELARELLKGSFGRNHEIFMNILHSLKTKHDETALAFFVYAIFILNDELVQFANLWSPNTKKKVGGKKSAAFIETLIHSW